MQNRQQGFTLIELVVVIVILGILAATALPRFADLNGDARNAAAQGVAAAITSGAAINYGARLVGNANARAVNTAAECTAANLQRFVTAGSVINVGTTLADATAAVANGTYDALTLPAGDCTPATSPAGTAVNCQIASRGGTAVATVTLLCTGA